jgi:Holliday junction resolvase RusA-like endonuclease
MARFSYSLEGVRVERKAIPLGGTIRLRLPFPPSTNHLFENTPGGGNIPTKRYRAWREAARAEILRQRPRLAAGPVEVTITLEERPSRPDAENLIKAVLDCLVANGIIAGDRSAILRRVTAQWGKVQGASVEITRLS